MYLYLRIPKFLRLLTIPKLQKRFQVRKKGLFMTVKFELEGQMFMVINGGPLFTPNEAISFVVYCDTQEEIDYFWEKLSFVPEAEQWVG